MECIERGIECTLMDIKDYDPEDNLTKEACLIFFCLIAFFIIRTFFYTFKARSNTILVIFISTYTDGVPPQSATWFYKYVTEMSCDFRFEKDTLKGLKYSICGLGNSLYEENFNKVAKELDKSFIEMRATQICRLYCCDENTIKSEHSSLEGDVAYWRNLFFEKLNAYNLNESDRKNEAACCQDDGNVEGGVCCKNNKTINTTIEEDEEEENGNDEDDDGNYETTSDDDDDDNNYSDIDDGDEVTEVTNGKKPVKIMKSKNGLIDLEDLGTVMNNIERKKKLKHTNGTTNGVVKEMVTPLLRKSLEKQNYKIIGSHSGVKLCRWTKSMLRGRGGCYKHSFYGIESHRCMETTPSLACANKCVFCWRHHT